MERGFVGPDAPTAERISNCVHCGVCLPVCPTYVETRNEASSPRGRIYLMGAIIDGRLPITRGFANEMDFCLGCRACETACPAAVPYGDLLERSRAQVEEALPRPYLPRVLRNLMIRQVLTRPGRLTWVARMARWYVGWGVRGLVETMGILRPFPRLRAAQALIPSVPNPPAGEVPSNGTGSPRVALFRGCVMEAFLGGTNRRTADLLRRRGCDVTIPPDQTCCGAIHLHGGLREEAKDQARRNIQAFGEGEAEAIVANAAGCGAALREYGDLLADDPEWAGRARAFSAKVRDISEYLVSLPGDPAFPPLKGRAVYQDACHLAHAQGIRSAPRALLGRVPDLELVEVPGADVCCGSAGIYNITRVDASMRFLDRKMEQIARADPDLIITGNVGCLFQLDLGVRRHGMRARVIHTVDALSGVGS